MKLMDKVAIITGGGRGMGEADSILFAEEGAIVITVDKNGASAKAVA